MSGFEDTLSDESCHVREKVRSGPVSRVLSWTVIYLEPTLPSVSSALPERSAGHTIALLFAFAPEGACQATRLPGCWWSLTPPFQLFSHLLAQAAGVFFSAALSVGSPRPAVSRLPALWSPDFPHGASAPRSSGPLRTRHCSMFGTPVHAQKMALRGFRWIAVSEHLSTLIPEGPRTRACRASGRSCS